MTNQFKQETKPHKQDESASVKTNNVKRNNGKPGNKIQSIISQFKLRFTPENILSSSNKLGFPAWKQLSLKTKATTLAIALTTIPIIALGTTAYYFTKKSIADSVTEQQQARAIFLANDLKRFIINRYQNIQTLAKLNIITDPQVRAITSAGEKQALLDQFIKDHEGYDSIAVTDLAGDVVAQSSGKVITNYKDIDYFQEVIKNKRPVITPPRQSLATGEYSIFVAAPVVDTVTGRIIGMVRSRTPANYLNKLLENQAKVLANNIKGFGSEEYYIINNFGKIFVAPTAHLNYVGKDIKSVFPKTSNRLIGADTLSTLVDKDQLEQEQYLISHSPVKEIEGLAEINWNAIVAQPEAQIFASQRNLLLTLLLGTGVTVLLAGAIASILVNRALRPIMNASNAVKRIGQGELDTRLAVTGEDELGILGDNINLMAEELQTLLHRQEEVVERAQVFADITLRIRQFLNTEHILKAAVKEVRKALKTDRVIIYTFDDDWKGTVVAESVAPGWTQAIAEKIEDPCFRERLVTQYQEGRVRAISNIYQAGLTECHIKLLEKFEVKANLVAPIIKDNQLLGLIIAHNCSKPRNWQQPEIDLLTQLATQIGFALDQANLLQQVENARSIAEMMSQEQRQQKEALQRQLVELLNQVGQASQGDLTVHAEVTSGEIGTVADFFNAIIESLRELVTQVKTTSAQVNLLVSENEGGMRHLADEAFNQAQEITVTLDSVEHMALSIESVANNAQLAAKVARTAYATAEAGEAEMERTVESILDLRQTVAATANKVKHLGESSQQISKVVALINQIALQTNVLAINASIEANRAGEEGRGFAVVAEEVGQLAAKASDATKEIEQIVASIQTETSEVVKAMELGRTQVIEGTYLVEDTKKRLGKILEVSHQIYQLVEAISMATVSQSQTSQAVTNLMKDIANLSEHTVKSSRQVSASLQQTVEVAQELQASVGVFKVDAEN